MGRLSPNIFEQFLVRLTIHDSCSRPMVRKWLFSYATRPLPKTGLCDLCEQPAPFQNKSNEAYLECHQIIWLAQGGEDTIANTVALCPLPRASKNCTVNQRASEFRHGGIF